MVVAHVGVSQGRRAALIAANVPVPPTITVQAIIDTGASGVCIDPSVLAQLNLTPTGTASVNTPTTGANPAQVNTYDVALMIPAVVGQPPLIHQTLAVMESDLFAMQGFHALIGMSVLRGCHLTVDGQTGLFSLAY
jgi:predicted aspartyl protease